MQRLGIICSVVLLIAGIVYLSHSTEGRPSTTEERSTANLDLAFSAWLPWWDSGNGLKTFKRYSDTFSDIHPFIYRTTAVDKIETQGKGTNTRNVMQAIRETSVANVPTLTETMDAVSFSTLVKDENQRTVHASTVCRWVDDNGFDGVDIDYEQFVVGLSKNDAPGMAPAFTALIADIDRCLGDKTLIVTVLPRTGDPRYAYFENNLSVSVFDYAALGKVANYLQPMAYDFSWSGSKPGSIDPIEWVKAVVKFTTDRVSPTKVRLGIPLYGYNWLDKGAAITTDSALRLAAENRVVPTRDPVTQSLVFTYFSNGDVRTVWFDDAQATALRVDVARQAGLDGVVFWALGQNRVEDWPAMIASPK